MPEITTITSETLQAEVRRLLPSQRGFGQDLEAQNVIVPIVDLTPTAEGSSLREDLQTACSFGNLTTGEVQNASLTLANTPGFYKCLINFNIEGGSSTNGGFLKISSGFTTKDVATVRYSAAAGVIPTSTLLNLVVFLASGEELIINSNSNDAIVNGSVWPIADVNGNFTQPSGFNPQ